MFAPYLIIHYSLLIMYKTPILLLYSKGQAREGIKNDDYVFFTLHCEPFVNACTPLVFQLLFTRHTVDVADLLQPSLDDFWTPGIVSSTRSEHINTFHANPLVCRHYINFFN